MIVDLIIIAILALSIFLGYRKGLIELSVKLVAVIIALVATLILYRPISSLIINTTTIDEKIQQSILNKSEQIISGENTQEGGIIAEVKSEFLPETAKELSYSIIRTIVIIALYIIIKIALRFITALADLVAKLPILKQFNKLGGTLDDAIGECYDKVARVIGLEYPGGPKLDKLAQLGKCTYQLPIPLHDDSYNFSFSGLKSAVINLAHNEEQRGRELNKEDLAASFEKVAIESVINKVKKAVIDKKIKYLIVAGGVAANQRLRKEIEKLGSEMNIEISIPPMKYCTDNATMIAAAGYYAYLDGRRADLSLNSKSQDKLV